jgi:hypothetical protein
MAERALYDNNKEPWFPFDAVRKHLCWLPAYLDERITRPSYDMEPLISTVLVFGRARTSTLQGPFWWREIRALVKRLNSALELAREPGACHKLEMVIRDRNFFVTCSNSPRFNWSHKLTHRDVGRNLDFFAPGHMSITEPKCYVSFVEIGSMQTIMAEAVLLDALEGNDVRNELEKFNQAREVLFNSTMERLGLRYRFKCIVEIPPTLCSVPELVLASNPPTQDWWEDNWVFVNRRSFLLQNRLDSRFTFAGSGAQYKAYWPLIKATFHFLNEYGRDDYWYTSEETGLEFWKSVENMCARIRSKCDQEGSDEDIETFIDEIIVEIDKLAKQADSPYKTPYAGTVRDPLPPQFPERIRTSCFQPIRALGFKLTSAKKLAKLYLFQRYKLRNRLVRTGIDGPAAADDPAFRPLRF